MYRHMYRQQQTYVRTDRQTDSNRHTYRQTATDIRTDRQIDSNRHTGLLRFFFFGSMNSSTTAGPNSFSTRSWMVDSSNLGPGGGGATTGSGNPTLWCCACRVMCYSVERGERTMALIMVCKCRHNGQIKSIRIF